MAKRTQKQFVEELACINPSVEIIGDYTRAAAPIDARCTKCGFEWSPTAANLLNGHACPKCARKTASDKLRKTHGQFVSELKKAQPEIKVLGKYKGSSKRIEVECLRCGHIWSPVPSTLLSGHGCPRCTKSQSSFVEQFILLAFSECINDVEARNRSAIGKELDIYIPSKMVAIEPGAWHWHKYRLENDRAKRELCKQKGIRLVTIYDSCPLDEAPFGKDCYIYSYDLAQEEGYSSLISLCKNLLEIVGEEAHCDWSQISAVASEASKMMTTEQFAERLKKINPTVVVVGQYRGSVHKVKVQCKECGNSWSPSALSLLSGHGCPYCSGRLVQEGINDLASQNPVIANEWNAEKNGGLLPSEVHVFSTRKVWWICPNGHEYYSVISNRTSNGAGCPYCSGNKVLKGFNDLETLYPDLAKEWDEIKNGAPASDYSAGSNGNKWWICSKGHGYQARIPDRITKGICCPYCSGHKVKVGFNDLATKNPQLASEWDYEANSPLKPTDVTPGSNKKVWWKCILGHRWQATVYSRDKGASCPYCSNKRLLSGFNDLETCNPLLASEWDYVKNGELTPSMVMPGYRKEVWWRCSVCGHSWKALVYSRDRGYRSCPECKKKHT